MSETPRDRYVIDANDVIWKCCPEYDNCMVTRGTATGQISAGIRGLRKQAGPLVEFSSADVRRWIGAER